METRFSRLTIGKLAGQAGVAVDTIRHYERQGLLPAPARSASGYREYDARALDRVHAIRRAQGWGFNLEEILELLRDTDDAEHGVKNARRRASERLRQIEARIADLQSVRDALERLIGACPGSGTPDACPILSALQGGTPSPAPSPPQGCGCVNQGARCSSQCRCGCRGTSAQAA